MADIDLSLYDSIAVSEYRTAERSDCVISITESVATAESFSTAAEHPWYDYVTVRESVTVCNEFTISNYETVTITESVIRSEAGGTDSRDDYCPKLPVRTLEATGGQLGSLDCKIGTRTSEGRGAGSLVSWIPVRELEGSGEENVSGTLEAYIGNRVVEGSGGGYLVRLLGTRSLYSTGTEEGIGTLDKKLPARKVSGTGSGGLFGVLDGTLSPRRMVSAEGFNYSGSLDKKISTRYLSAEGYLVEAGSTSDDSMILPVRELEATGEDYSGSLDCEIAARVVAFSMSGKESGSGAESSRFTDYELRFTL